MRAVRRVLARTFTSWGALANFMRYESSVRWMRSKIRSSDGRSWLDRSCPLLALRRTLQLLALISSSSESMFLVDLVRM